MIKKFVFALILFTGNQLCYSQIAIKLMQIRPYGDLGAIFKTSLTGELSYLDEFDEHTRMRYGFTYTSFTPRLDTFPVIAEVSASNLATVQPGYDVIHHYSMALLNAGMDFSILKSENFFLYPGVDILAGFTSLNHDESYEGISDESSSGGGIFIGFKLRIGAEYMLNDKIGFLFEAAHNMYLTSEKETFAHKDFGIGVHYLFN